ncbi:MAG: MerR family transcriptional regulator [Candidatus Competibacteraceae bacterium]|jgi:DNA-binding transcriptional MerR regulator/methylmalonyl-CoA mutase cobalamin-binding subunit|nr:MerR family transcriptional regulator [Candidatus Competibacteraceae bacterium]
MATSSQNSEQLPRDGLLPIRTVSNLTGVNPVTLRAWERRYGLIKPIRTPKGHRLYALNDVDLINQIVNLLNNGMSISQVGQVLHQDQQPVEVLQDQQEYDPWTGYRQRLVQAIGLFDERILNQIYTEALSLYPIELVTHQLIVPLLRELGDRWEQGQGSVAEEHFFSVFMRNKLGARFHHHSRDARGPKLLAACLPGEHHEVGILLFALAALDRDFRVVLLGANTPLTALPDVVEQTGGHAVVLSGSQHTPAAVVEKELPEFVKQIQTPVFIGGQVTACYTQILEASGAIVLGDDFGLALRTINAQLRRSPSEPNR